MGKMPYNIELEKRIDRLADQSGKITKKKMFGGIGYMLNGNMVFGIHKQALLIRTSPEQAEKLLKKEFMSVFDMTGRPMKAWLLVDPGGWKTEKQLQEFLDLSIAYVKTLPGK
jgi:TfoX/Sxy family transcriptional regulator of competence genes